MIGRFVKRERIRINYEAKRLTTGLADVTISIIRTDGNKEIDGASMAELNSTNAPGVYYYDWVATKSGMYTVYCDSTSQSRVFIDTLSIVGRGDKYTQVMGVHGGMTTNRVIVKDTWKPEERDKLIEDLNKLVESNKKTQMSVDSLIMTISLLNGKVKSIEISTSTELEKSKIMNQNLFSEIANRINGVDDKTDDMVSKILTANSMANNLHADFNNDLKIRINKRFDEIKIMNSILSSRVNNLKEETKELHENVNDFSKFMIKILPDEKLMELQDEIEQPDK